MFLHKGKEYYPLEITEIILYNDVLSTFNGGLAYEQHLARYESRAHHSRKFRKRNRNYKRLKKMIIGKKLRLLQKQLLVEVLLLLVQLFHLVCHQPQTCQKETSVPLRSFFSPD